MTDTHRHGGSSHSDLPEPSEVVALLRSVQNDLSGVSDDAAARAATRLDQAADGVVALGDALDRERAYSAHMKEHYVDCEASASYRIGHAIVRTAKAPKQLLDSLRSDRR